MSEEMPSVTTTASEPEKISEHSGAEHEILSQEAVQALRSERDLLKQTAEKHKDLWVRALADLENMKRLSKMDLEKAHKFAVESLLCDLLPVMDSLEQALLFTGEGLEKIQEGLLLTLRMFQSTLAKFGVEVLEAEGASFDPSVHEAMTMQAVERQEDHQKVLQVFQKGYRLNGKVIRPARVAVGRFDG